MSEHPYSPLQTALAELRKSLNFKSARAFYQDYLNQRTRLDFNYSYYMKIEGGKIIPSSQIVSALCSALEDSAAESLMLAYCETIFPQRASVFQKMKKRTKPEKAVATSAPQDTSALKGHQKYLTPAQVACIGKSRSHYYAFLILTLAREPITLVQLADYFKGEKLDLILKDLEKSKLIMNTDDDIRSISNEMRFPEAQTATEKKLYEQIDVWNANFQQVMGFDTFLQKMLLRRVSTRYLSLIQSHLNVLFDLVRTSDEVEQDHNHEVLMLNVSLQRGQLPG
jgi:hypothetical protein